jgi:sucrose-phosphate synthase
MVSKRSKPGLYIVLISVHGLIRGQEMELGRDADTGGQTKYVVDLAKALGAQDGVAQVDLVTRRIVDDAIDPDYAEAIEALGPGARIIRIDAGPDEYLPKEQLWDHLDSMGDNLVGWLNDQPRMPDIVHAHYADAGYVGVRVANLLGVPLVFTGHSLGRDKRKRLLASGLSGEAIEKTYNIARRIAAEEETLANAELVITSTNNEIREQYELYNYYDPERMAVLPPGTDLTQFFPPLEDDEFEFEQEISPFLREPGKPIILALSRPDERKNIAMLLRAFGKNKKLQEKANLVIVAGNRTDIRNLGQGAQDVLTSLLILVDRYDLYGKVALPKQHKPRQVPEIYRLAAARRGVFVNPALTEPFGLTLLEAAATGLPVVATENGGPVDIIGNCRNGLLVNPLQRKEIGSALLQLLSDDDAWRSASKNGLEGVRQHYTWQAHASSYLEELESAVGRESSLEVKEPADQWVRYRDRALFTDLDQSLLGDPDMIPRFAKAMRRQRQRVTFGIATGRRIDSALAIMKKHGIPSPDVLISSMGTRIHYDRVLIEDKHWADHIDHGWNRSRIVRVLADTRGIKLQPKRMQSRFKISWYYDPLKAPTIDEIISLLHQHEITANVIGSFGQYLDIIPSRASKGQALRYVALRLDIPLEQILVAGGSGGDEDMMRGNALAVVVANRHNEELSQLVDLDRIYFAEASFADGILEAVDHYRFFEQD